MFDYSNHLGAFGQFYTKAENGDYVFYESFQELLEGMEGKKELDRSAVLSVLSKNFILGDKTILAGVSRTPWMSNLRTSVSTWNYHEIPSHRSNQSSAQISAKSLFDLISNEIQKYVQGSDSVGILLSGGMDSRIVAGVLDTLIHANKIDAKSITAYTWGNPDSRDVIYSKEIAKRLGWNWKHYQVDASKLWRNIELACERGCEYSGVHLHAMPDIAEDALREVDLVLAGSYGDSVGRAEYSGRHVSKLKPIRSRLGKMSDLLNLNKGDKLISELEEEIYRYHRLFPRESTIHQNELDYQLHYMRRMLNPCMEVINERVPLFQVFTDPNVYGYMWSLDLKSRNDEVYRHLVKMFRTDLTDIPWARTGLPYNTLSGKPDTYSKKHHSYEEYLQNDLIPKFRQISKTHKSTIIDTKQLNILVTLVNKLKGFNFDYLEAITVSISILMFERKYLGNKNSVQGRKIFRLGRLTLKYCFNYLKRYLKKQTTLIFAR